MAAGTQNRLFRLDLLNEAKDALDAAWRADNRVAIIRLALASEALVRAVQNVSCAVECLADC
jgi:hypothetical protein